MIAAAPGLLAACKDIDAFLPVAGGYLVELPEYVNVALPRGDVLALRAAIAKAEG